MRLFNLKKSKNDSADDFEASDEWLMGLADDDPDRFGSGPNASIPTELHSLAPPSGFDPEPIAEIGRTNESSGNGWHLPDLAAADLDDHAQDSTDDWAAPPPPPPALLFDDRHPRDQVTDPFPYDETIVDPTLGGTEGPSGFGSHLFADGPLELDRTEHDSIANPIDSGLQPHRELETSVSDAVAFDAAAFDAPLFDHPLLDSPELDNPPVGAPVFSANDDHELNRDDHHDFFIQDADIQDAEIEDADIEVAAIDSLVAYPASEPVQQFAALGQSEPPPRGPEPDMLCEILGVEPGAGWAELRAAHARAMAEHDPDRESEGDRAALARAIRREINSAYAGLRLLAAS